MRYNNYEHMTINIQSEDKNPVGRPTKWRRVASLPQVTYFKPAALPLRMLEEVCLSVEETEAIRLKDLEGLAQEGCAQEMNISRPTFQRLLCSGRQKLADALVNGKAIRIEGGNFEMATRRFRCQDGHEWDVPFETLITNPPAACPTCQTPYILPLQTGLFGRRGQGRHRGGRGSW